MSELEKGWSQIYRSDQAGMAMPVELTKAWWDKKKQLLAKTRATGMGEALDKLNKLYGDGGWFPKLNTHPDLWETSIEEAKAHMGGSLIKSFRTQIDEVIKLALSESKEMKKGVTTKDTGKRLDDIAEMAEKLKVAVNSASLGTALEKAIEAGEQTVRTAILKRLGPAVQALQDTEAKVPKNMDVVKAKLKEFVKDQGQPNRAALGSAIAQGSRALTTPLGNIIKAGQNGAQFTVDLKVLQTLHKALSVYASDQSHTFMADLGSQGAVLLSSEVFKVWNAYLAMLKRFAVA